MGNIDKRGHGYKVPTCLIVLGIRRLNLFKGGHKINQYNP